jgi:putative phosphoribosyl transferase
MPAVVVNEAVQIPMGSITDGGNLHLPARATGLVVFAHECGNSASSWPNRAVDGAFESACLGTLVLDFSASAEESGPEHKGEHRFEIDVLGRRFVGAIDWSRTRAELRSLPIGLFGASTGAAAALIAAAERPEAVRAVISRGGRPDLAGSALSSVQAPTLVIVGGRDESAIGMSRDAIRHMQAPVELEIIPGATHMFEEPDALEQATRLAAYWCQRHLG